MIAEDPEKTREIDAQSAKLRELIKARGPACPETRRRAAAILGATLAGGVATPPPAPLSPPPAPPPSVSRKLGALALVGLLALAVGCVPVEALDHVREQHAIMAGHAADPHHELSLRARQIAADAMRALSKQHRLLSGEELEHDPLPPELEAAAPALVDDGGR